MKQRTVMGSMRVRRLVLMGLRVGLAVTFMVAGVVKLRQSPVAFADSIASFRLLPRWAIHPLALGLPPFEILAGAALLVGRPRRLGAFCVLSMNTVFLLALVLALARGTVTNCGCFGDGPPWLPLSGTQRMWVDLIRDAAFAAAALVLYRHDANAGKPNTGMR